MSETRLEMMQNQQRDAMLSSLSDERCDGCGHPITEHKNFVFYELDESWDGECPSDVPEYCVLPEEQREGASCFSCSLNNYGRDCMNNEIESE